MYRYKNILVFSKLNKKKKIMYFVQTVIVKYYNITISTSIGNIH